MLRTAYSQILNSSRDFSTAICDRRGAPGRAGRARADPRGGHPLGGRTPCATSFVDRVQPGDVFLLNDPYHGNNHLPDLTAFVPVFVGRRGGVLVGQPRAPERHRRLHARRLQPRARPRSGRRASASRRSSSTTPASCATTCMQMIADQRAPPARLHGRPARHDRLGPRGRAAPAVAGGILRRQDGDRLGRTRSSTAPSGRRAPACATWKDGVYRGVTVPGRRRPRRRRHPDPRHGHQEGRRAHHRPERVGAPGDRLRELARCPTRCRRCTWLSPISSTRARRRTRGRSGR
mgnify:CR=1 FL=1